MMHKSVRVKSKIQSRLKEIVDAKKVRYLPGNEWSQHKREAMWVANGTVIVVELDDSLGACIIPPGIADTQCVVTLPCWILKFL
jgi:hypothetical protein